MKLVEPPSCSSPSTIVFIGKNKRGQWVAQEQNGLYGGLFVSRAQAVKYALFENGHHPETIVELSREIELDMGDKLPFPARPARRMTNRASVIQEGQMDQPHSVSNREQVVDTMIDLTRLSNLHRAIVAGQRQHGALSGAATARIHSGGHHRDLPHSRSASTRSA